MLDIIVNLGPHQDGVTLSGGSTSQYQGNGKTLGTYTVNSTTFTNSGEHKCFATEQSRETIATNSANVTVLGKLYLRMS